MLNVLKILSLLCYHENNNWKHYIGKGEITILNIFPFSSAKVFFNQEFPVLLSTIQNFQMKIFVILTCVCYCSCRYYTKFRYQLYIIITKKSINYCQLSYKLHARQGGIRYLLKDRVKYSYTHWLITFWIKISKLIW